MNAENQEQPTLKALRESRELTQPELSRRLNVGIRIIGHWESGSKVPRFDNAIALARELGVSLKTLAKSMQLDVSAVPDDELQLWRLKAVCRERGITQIEDLPDDWVTLMRSQTTE